MREEGAAQLLLHCSLIAVPSWMKKDMGSVVA
jgi:hypothetical protein